MQFIQSYGMRAVIGLVVLGLSAWPAGPTQSETTTLVKVDGSSTVFPITEAVAEEFQKETRGSVRVTVGISGTGGGFKKFCRGETDVQDASRPISASEMEACRASGIQYYELPIAFDALTIAVSQQATWIDSITVAELKKIWEPAAQGRVMKWNQIRSTWPDQPLKLFGAGSDSGTFDYFTEAVVGKAKASRGDYTASEDDNTLVQGISNDKQALGYIPYAYFEPNKKRLKAVAVDGGYGPMRPSRETVENGLYQPLSRPMFIYVNVPAASKPEVKRFVEFYLAQAPTLVPQVKYVPLPKETYSLVLSHFQKGKLGTAFQGHSTIGLTIEDLLKREATL
ncbi:MAG: PstS family phosphate ABC transporter substrate-binding protein [Nitrospira sp.]|jgi:phosphate transport system substrate-binding protein|nr:PstS family phosphate ABC transporter substrate-binding protein [Nitrospira sp.]